MASFKINGRTIETNAGPRDALLTVFPTATRITWCNSSSDYSIDEYLVAFAQGKHQLVIVYNLN